MSDPHALSFCVRFCKIALNLTPSSFQYKLIINILNKAANHHWKEVMVISNAADGSRMQCHGMYYNGEVQLVVNRLVSIPSYKLPVMSNYADQSIPTKLPEWNTDDLSCNQPRKIIKMH